MSGAPIHDLDWGAITNAEFPGSALTSTSARPPGLFAEGSDDPTETEALDSAKVTWRVRDRSRIQMPRRRP
jgi:hypothetical protein